ncbi:MAG: DUF5924 family protein [Myxococcota bacterium]
MVPARPPRTRKQTERLEESPRGVAGFLRKHGRHLWWLHSLYALGLGVFVVLFARKGFDYARWLAPLLVAAWLVTVLLFRVAGSGREQKLVTPGQNMRFYAMSYVLKNLYQAMLFFALPFYAQAATLDAANLWFVVVLAAFAVASTMDLFFDGVLVRHKVLATVFYTLVLFTALALSLPALLPDLRPRVVLVVAAAFAAFGFFTLHVPPRQWHRPWALSALALSMAATVGTAWFGQRAIPPVPFELASAAVGPSVMSDGGLTMELGAIRRELLQTLVAVSEVRHPARTPRPSELRHVWRQGLSTVVARPAAGRPADGPNVLRLTSTMDPGSWPADPTGSWSVDVETEDGQLIGRTRFSVRD